MSADEKKPLARRKEYAGAYTEREKSEEREKERDAEPRREERTETYLEANVTLL